MGLKSRAWVSKETLENAFDLPAYKGSLISNSVMMLTQKVAFAPVPNNLIAPPPFKSFGWRGAAIDVKQSTGAT